MGRNIRIKLAKELCEIVCGCEWDRPVSFEVLPTIEEALKSHVLVLDLDNPSILGESTCVYRSLMYKSEQGRYHNQYWLLFDNEHYHAISNIEAFLAVRAFCPKCLQGFTHNEDFTKHICAECEEGVFSKKSKRIVKDKTLHEDVKHYLREQEMKGGRMEVDREMVLYLSLIHISEPTRR
eukprot:7211848-Heterocapsa_arctica.AAC.1